MDFIKKDGLTINDEKMVRVKQMKNIVQIMHMMTECSGLNKIKKLNKEEYMLVSTGEVFKYQLSDNRGENIAGLKGTFKTLRELINNNFDGSGNELHITLTYAENMTDKEKLYKDFKLFWKNFLYKHGKHFEYLSIVEPQGRGAWHHHLLIKDTKNDKLFIPWKDIKQIWPHGNIDIKALKGVDNIGAYLSAYLSDIELTNDFQSVQPEIFKAMLEDGQAFGLKEVEVDGITKKFLKGARCRLYPPGFNIYRKSKGMLHPEEQKMFYWETKRIVGSAKPNYSRTIEILEDKIILNCITYEHYNLIRISENCINVNIDKI